METCRPMACLKRSSEPNKRFERDAPPASFACCLRAPQAQRWASHEGVQRQQVIAVGRVDYRSRKGEFHAHN